MTSVVLAMGGSTVYLELGPETSLSLSSLPALAGVVMVDAVPSVGSVPLVDSVVVVAVGDVGFALGFSGFRGPCFSSKCRYSSLSQYLARGTCRAEATNRTCQTRVHGMWSAEASLCGVR
jgi:hypothetical protein